MQEYIQKLRNWFLHKEQLVLAFFQLSLVQKIHPLCFAGDVYYAYLGINIGGEINKSRPVLIFQNYDLRNLNTVIVLPLTTKQKPGLIKITSQDLKFGYLEESFVVVSQIRTIAKQRLTKRIAKIKGEKLSEIACALQKIFPLPEERGDDAT